MFAYIVFYGNQNGTTLAAGPDDLAQLRDIIARTPGLSSGLIFTPETAEDLFNHDGASPPLGVQLHFETLDELETAVGPTGHLQALSSPGVLSGLKGAKVTQQAMVVRPYPVDDPMLRTSEGALPCSYVVHYPGPAEDINAWLSHYIAGHPPIMRKFPAIRSIEILSRVDWCGGIDAERVAHIQRNRIVFDSAAALEAALQSPVRHEMRADFHTFPPFEGGNFHYPMATETVLPAG
ncbi:hypothetical protein [Rhizobium halophytocola]|uniref:EthD family reductase n=1 Tax=Rhizobium halophytocola TaxID=735519 RepID=A0ABS4DV82_9HYPH|nr:hypothetical protein [Rhizobium halophytocola]MBP1849601.1 hypothetical protein [Rhizobium halophytocola]